MQQMSLGCGVEWWPQNNNNNNNNNNNKTLAKYKWDLILLLSSSRINFLLCKLVIKDISELPIKMCQNAPLGKEGEGLSLWRISKSFTARNEQWAMKTMAVHSGVFRASENCSISGRSNASNLWITPVKMNRMNNVISAIVWNKQISTIYHCSKGHVFVFFPLEVFWDVKGSLVVATIFSPLHI